MRFHVGPLVMTVRVVADMPRGASGEAAAGVIDLDAGEVRLWSGSSGPLRLHVLLHELAHGWRYVLGVSDEAEQAAGWRSESMANVWAMYAQQAITDLEEQGGVGALAAMTPEGDAAGVGGGHPALTARAAGGGGVTVGRVRRRRVRCPRCKRKRYRGKLARQRD